MIISGDCGEVDSLVWISEQQQLYSDANENSPYS